MKFIKTISIPGALIISALIISISIFVTGWVFLGKINAQKLPLKTPPNTQAPLSPEQIKKMQEERAAQMQKRAATPAPTATTTR